MNTSRCPNCDDQSRTSTDFVHTNYPFTEEEGHDVTPHDESGVDRYLVCPDCAFVIG